jgi:type IV pilus assembly protein PilB
MSPPTRPRLGELLVRAGVISPEQADAAAAVHRANGRTIGQQLLADDAITELELTAALAYQVDVPFVLLDTQPVDEVAMHLVPAELARAHRALVIGSRDDELLVAMADPTDLRAREAIAERTGRRVVPVLAMTSDLQRALDRYAPAPAVREVAREPEPARAGQLVPFPRAGPRAAAEPQPEVAPQEPPAAPAASPRPVALRAADEPAAERREPLVAPAPGDAGPESQIVRFVLAQAIRDGASDVHVEPLADRLRIRLRVEGVLRETTQLPRDMSAAVAARIRSQAAMAPADTQGRLVVRDAAGEATFDVSGVSTLWGEKLGLRVIERTGQAPDLDDLGMDAGTLERWRALLGSSYGLLLVAGMPGMGKTTTLYASLRELPAATKDITTVEDPVDRALDGVNQVQVDRASGATLASTLRSVLAQQPDIVLVGELRDRDVAESAMNAALAGRLVLSSIQAPDALAALYRIRGLGADPSLVSASALAVLAQVLLPRLCEHCPTATQPTMIESALLRQAGLAAERVFVARGCARCDGTGYRGRIAAFELLTPGDDLRAAIAREAKIEEARDIAARAGLVALRTAGLRLVAEGFVSMPDLLARIPAGG